MATNTVWKDAAIIWDGDDISGDMNSVTGTFGYNTEVVNGFGDDTEKNAVTIRTVALDVSGFYVADTIDAAIAAKQVSGTTKRNLTIVPLGLTEGYLSYLIKAELGNTTQGGNFGEMAKVTLPFTGAGDWCRGTLAEYGVKTTGAGTGYELGAVTASQTLVGQIHVISGSSTTVDAIVESDADNTFASAVTRLTHSQIADTGSDRQEVSGAITDTWYRYSLTISGTVTLVASIGIVG